jgi:hypothetical protein
MTKEQRPEALAQFAESARRGERAGVQGLMATQVTAPIPTDSKAKDEAAAKILAEGATGEDRGSEEAIEHLPDRILDTQGKDNTPSPIPDATLGSDVSYDATRDPRTGRPPNLLDAQRIARENELERLRLASDPGSVDDEAGALLDGVTYEDSPDHDETDEFSDVAHVDNDELPPRMASPSMTEDERPAVEDLVSDGLSRENAEGLVETHGSNRETLTAAIRAADNAKDQGEENL